LSLHYFSRRFRREVGQSPVRYLHWFRVERAKPLLAHSNHSIERIARSVGFPDPRYFGKIFARLEGTSPRLYRQQGERKARSRPGHDPSRTRDA
jgi:iron complex transport system substrate-binding protein